ncbi:hypothetical protein EDD11_007739 [Mortierella claussenii]|nr:hypothetical protein EDD11_007739 [Mortierella claussenii]
MYSGYLLKLGSNDRWQSRLFTFDGSVLTCIGKKPKAPVIITYDPNISSPFMSTACSPSPLNPNTKWFINIASVVDIKLLSISRPHRCFPYMNLSKELFIRTLDGRNMVLRARKDVELERWYFLLFKIWEYQQQLSKTEAIGSPRSTRFLATHQPSAHLFQKHLQKRHSDPQQADQQQPSQLQRAASYHLRPTQAKPRESLLPYQIPPPPRVSAFLPQGLEWSLPEQDDEDDIPARFLPPFHRSHSVYEEKERRPLERQSTWSHRRHAQRSSALNIGTCNKDGSMRSLPADILPQRSECLVANIMEPRKAAIIDNWRRSLLTPAFIAETTSVLSDEVANERNKARETMLAKQGEMANGADGSLDRDGKHTNSRDMVPTSKHSSLGRDFKRLSTEVGCVAGSEAVKQTAQEETEEEDNTSIEGKNLLSRNAAQDGQTYMDNKSSNFHSGLGYPPAIPSNSNSRSDTPRSQGDAVDALEIRYAHGSSTAGKEEDELPLGLIQAKRNSRLTSTQLSSHDSAPGAQWYSRPNLSETAHRLLPSEPITPEWKAAEAPDIAGSLRTMIASSQDMYLEHRPMDIHHLASSLSNPSLSLHGSNFSHPPIHEPAFVYSKKQRLSAHAMADEHPAEPAQAAQAASQDAASKSAPERSLFSVHIPIRNFRRGHTPSSSAVTKGAVDASKRFMTIDTSPYTNIAITNPNHPVPPRRPTRPPEVTLSPLFFEPEDALSSMKPFGSMSSSAAPPLPPLPATYNQQQHHYQHHPHHYHGKRASLTRSISAMSSVSQIQPQQHPSSVVRSCSAYRSQDAVDDDDEDDDEPLAITLSRRQSLRRQS